MAYKIELKKSVIKQLDSLPNKLFDKIVINFQALSENPYLKTKKIKLEDAFRIRIGNYRILYKINEEEKIVNILDIAHRREIYRKL